MPDNPQVQQNNMTMGNTKNLAYLSTIPDQFNANMQPQDSLPANKWKRIRNVDFNVQYQKNPYAPPTFISKGSVVTNTGGSHVMYDKTGGTKIFYYDPASGSVVINGILVANTVSTGSYSNITLGGTNSVTGSMMNGNYGTPQITGGTLTNTVIINPNSMNGTIGTAAIQGGTLYNNTIGSPSVTNGTFTNGIMNAITFGSPSVTSGTFSNSVVNSPTIGTQNSTGGTLGAASFNGTLTGTVVYAANAGTAGIGTNMFAFQTKGGSALLVINIGGTNFLFTPSGTQ